MKESPGFFKTVFENFDIPLYVVDEKLKIIFCNKALTEFADLEKTDITGKRVSNLPPSVLRDVSKEENFKGVIETGKPYLKRSKIGTSKKEKFIETRIMPLQAENDDVDGAITLLLDVTDRKKAEEKLKNDYRNLKHLDDLRENLIANVSHELMTPLSVCLSAIDLLADEEDGEKKSKLLGMIRNSLIRQSRIINDLVGISKLRMGNIKLNVEDVDLETVVSIAKSEMEFVALKKNIKIKTKIQKDLPKISFDIDELKHILSNLLDNAIKFNKEGGKIKIEAKKGGNFIVVCVADTGIGIAEERLDNVFDRFYQIDSSTTRAYAGTGLGLAVVKEIVKTYKGEVWVESEKGEGSKFYFTIPAVSRMKKSLTV